MPNLSEVARAAGTSYDDINNMIRRGLLATPLAPAGPGRPRDFSRANALEIAFLAALNRAGVSPVEAGPVALEWLRREAAGTLPPFAVFNPRTGKSFEFSNAKMPLDALRLVLPDALGKGRILDGDDPGDYAGEQIPATTINIIAIHDIVARIDALFA